LACGIEPFEWPNLICDPGHTIKPNLTYCTECGGHDQYPCLNFVTNEYHCDSGHTLNPNLLDLGKFGKCVACGAEDENGDSQFICVNPFYPDEWGCQAGYTLDPDITDDWENILGKCVACGGNLQYQCFNILEGEFFCDDNHTTFPVNPLLCMSCADEGGTLSWSLDAMRFVKGGCEVPWEKQNAFGVCNQAWDLVAEPDCDMVEVVTLSDGTEEEFDLGISDCIAEPQIEGEIDGDPLYGIADTHTHPFSNLAFGGALLWGSPFDERGINAALATGFAII
jgi:hypothetical protein